MLGINTNGKDQIWFYTSTAYRYSDTNLSEAENLALFGRDHSWDGLGCNFRVDFRLPLMAPAALLAIAGQLSRLTQTLDHQYLNELPQFSTGPVSLERIGNYFFSECAKLDLGVQAVRITDGQSQAVEVSAENQAFCATFPLSLVFTDMTGVAAQLEVAVTGPLEPRSHMICVREQMRSVVQQTVIDKTHGRVLAEKLSAAEATAWIFKELQNKFMTPRLFRVALREANGEIHSIGAPLFDAGRP